MQDETHFLTIISPSNIFEFIKMHWQKDMNKIFVSFLVLHHLQQASQDLATIWNKMWC